MPLLIPPLELHSQMTLRHFSRASIRNAYLGVLSQDSCTTPRLLCQYWSQLSDSVFLDRVNSAKIPLFYGFVKHFSRTPPNPSSTPILLAILLAIGRC